jgi:ferredoxin
LKVWEHSRWPRVSALIDDAKIDQLHSCGGNSRCTTCRVRFIEGEPGKVTQAERTILSARGLGAIHGLRLSCQITVDQDMHVVAESRFAGSGKKDAGPRPADQIEPPPVWT